MSIPLIEKYRAKSFSDIIGQDVAIAEIRNFFELFPKKRAIILNGTTGSGKTSLVLALAKELNYELFELNASDLRNKSSLEEVLAPATAQASLFSKGKVILMDEADGITGSDRGGVPELVRLITTTKFPIIITANDIWHKKFSPLRQKCKIIDLKPLSNDHIKQILQHVMQKEGIVIHEKVLNHITISSQGDVRAALNDLQSVFTLGELPEKDDEISSKRELKKSIFDALREVFQEMPNKDTLRAFEGTDLELDEILLWVEENVPLEYRGSALARAIEAISKADLFKGRIYRKQYWRFLVYENFFLTAGVSSATKLKSKTYKGYKKPGRILKIWLSNQKNAKKKSVVTKFARATHQSVKKTNPQSYLLPLLVDPKDKAYDLDEKDAAYIEDKKAALIVALGLNKFRLDTAVKDSLKG